MALIDSGKYAQSHDDAADYFRNAIRKDQWQATMQSGRVPLGKVVSRTFKAATYAKSLPGAPDGEYVVIQYDSSFENKKTAVETVTPKLEKDGTWKVSGYYIK